MADKRVLTIRLLPLLILSTAVFILLKGGRGVVVDAAPGNAAQGRKGSGVGIKQHFVALRGIGRNHEGSIGAEFEVGRQDLAQEATDQEMLFTPVELEGFAQFEFERNIGVDRHGSAFDSPMPDKFSNAAVVACKTWP